LEGQPLILPFLEGGWSKKAAASRPNTAKNCHFFSTTPLCEEVPRLCDKNSPLLWIQTPRPLKEVGFGLTGMLKSDTRYHNIDFCSLDEVVVAFAVAVAFDWCALKLLKV
jgi:hypothetical protein